MLLALLLTMLLYASLQAQENSFTINSIQMESRPSWEVANGQKLTLQCLVDISTTSKSRPQHQVLFYKDDALVYNVSSSEHTESFVIPQARVFHAGKYKCTVILNSKEKTSTEYQVTVNGVPMPEVTVDKKEVTEGGIVTVNCSMQEEKPPIYFKIEKVELGTKNVKLSREKTSNMNFVLIEFPIEEQDHLLVFRCQAGVLSGIKIQTSEFIRSEYVTVQEFFSTPKFQIQPPGMIIEGNQLHIKCSVQVAHLAREFPEIIIQKDKAIVATSKQSKEAVYSVMALVEHSGHYTCKVESNRISKASNILVNITELFPKPKLELSSSRLDQGEMLDLSCSVSGAPVANFTIQKEETVLSQYQNFSKIAEERDSGLYSCTAGIGKVVKRSNLVPVQVCEMLSKPRIFHDAKFEIVKGQFIGISCQSVNGTAPITYRLIRAKSNFQTVQKNSSDPVTFRDKPTRDVEYQCIVDNCHSHPEVRSEILRVKVIAPVDEVTISILSGNDVQSGDEMVLRCSVKEGTGPVTFQFYKEKEGRPFHEETVNDTQVFWHHEQASKEQEGQYYCTAFNRASIVTSLRSSPLTVRVFLAPWKKGLIAVVVIGVVIAALIVAAKCYFLRKAKAKQKPVEMSRPAVPLLNSNSEKVSEPSVEANSHYGYDDVSGIDAVKPINQNKDPQNMDVEYTEVEVSSLEPHQENGRLP